MSQDQNALAMIGGQIAVAQQVGASTTGAEGMFPTSLRNPGARAAVVLAGLELGMQPMQALRSLHIIEGRVVIAADAQLAIVMRAGVSVDWLESTPTAAKLKIQRGERRPLEVAYTMEDAQRAGLAGRGTWKAHPAAMLRARCITTAIRMYCPDILAGAYSPDEADDFRRDQPAPVAPPRPPAAAPPPTIDVEPEPVAPVRTTWDEAADELRAVARERSPEAQEWVAKMIEERRPEAYLRRQTGIIRAKIERERAAQAEAADEREPGDESEGGAS